MGAESFVTQQINQILERIPEWDRDVLELYLSGFSLKEIAYFMNISYKIAKERLDVVSIVLVDQLEKLGIHKDIHTILEDADLAMTVEGLIQRRLAELPGEEELDRTEVHFDFERLLYLADQSKKYFYLSGKAVSKITFYLILIIMLMSVTAFAVFQMRFRERGYHNRKEVYLDLEGETKMVFIETLYLPAYLPKGYHYSQQLGDINESNIIQTYYSNGEYELSLQQAIQNSFTTYLDGEDMLSKYVKVNGFEGIYQEDTKEKIIIWLQKDYFYSLKSFDSEISEEELLRVAESVKEINTNEEK